MNTGPKFSNAGYRFTFLETVKKKKQNETEKKKIKKKKILTASIHFAYCILVEVFYASWHTRIISIFLTMLRFLARI